MNRAKLKTNNLTDQISEAMTSRISAGEFTPGSQLPTALELSLEFGVSRTVVREAISRLKSEGLVVTRQGAGVFVAENKLGMPFRIAADRTTSTKSTVEILELRLAVESEAAALAAQRASRSQLQAIKGALDAMRKALALGEDGVDEDLLFHHAIAEATGNTLYVELSEFLERHVRHQMLSGGKAARAGRSLLAQAEHEDIYKAIISRDADAARSAARTHFRKSIERREQSKPH